MRLDTLLLDRDGTIIEDKHYLANPDEVVLLPHVGEVLGRLAKQGWRFFVVSNQSGVGRGYFTEESVRLCMQRMEDLLAKHGVSIAGVVYCPHAPEEGCTCRKPATGLWENLQENYHICADNCVMVGDKVEDMQFALNANLAGRVLVGTGKGQLCAASLGLSIKEQDDFAIMRKPTENLPYMYIRDFEALEQALGVMASESKQCV